MRTTRRTVAALAAAACLAWAMPAAAQGIVLHLGHVQQATHPIQRAAELFAAEVEQGTGGAVRVQVYPSEQLAGLRAGAEGVQLGTIMTDLNLMMNAARFDSLTPEEHEVPRAAGRKAMGGFLTEALQAAEVGAHGILAAALVTDDAPDVASFQAAMLPVRDTFVATAGPRAAAWIAGARGE